VTYQRPLEQMPAELILGALATLPGAFWLRTDSGCFAGALPTARSSAFDPEPALAIAARAPGPAEAPFPRWVGALPYEAVRGRERDRTPDPRPAPGLLRPVWQRYDAVVRLDESEGPILLAEDEGAAGRLETALRSRRTQLSPAAAVLSWAGPPEPEAVHRERIAAALEFIARGQLYQVNLARRFEFRQQGHPFELLLRLSAHGQKGAGDVRSPAPLALAPFAAAIDFGAVAVVSTSPESFLKLGEAGYVATCPIKGTRPRHVDPERDRALARELDESEKERAELAMVIDIERSDLGRLAIPGTVSLAGPPSVVSHASVHHRHALVTGRLRPGVTRSEVFDALMPSGSVTGAPKVRAMDLIRQLEAHRRGLYTGALGTLLSDGTLELSMAIRCLVLTGGSAEYFSGGGIVADSDPDAEVQETLWKAEQLLALLGPQGLRS